MSLKQLCTSFKSFVGIALSQLKEARRKVRPLHPRIFVHYNVLLGIMIFLLCLGKYYPHFSVCKWQIQLNQEECTSKIKQT